MPKLTVVTKHEERDGLRMVNLSLPTAVADAVMAAAQADDRSLAMMCRVLIREAVAARAAKQAPQ